MTVWQLTVAMAVLTQINIR